MVLFMVYKRNPILKAQAFGSLTVLLKCYDDSSSGDLLISFSFIRLLVFSLQNRLDLMLTPYSGDPMMRSWSCVPEVYLANVCKGE